MTTRKLVVVDPGLSSLVQDGGRPGLGCLGVGRSGAADRVSFAWANEIVGNHPAAAVIETLLGGLTLRAVGDHWLTVAGAAMPARLDGALVLHQSVIRLRDGQKLTLGAPPTGLRGYVAVRGGIEVAAVLGSRSHDTLSGIGPAPLTVGQALPVGPLVDGPLTRRRWFDVTSQAGGVTLHAVIGPRNTLVPHAAALGEGEWVATANSSRVALRLARAEAEQPALAWRTEREQASEGIVRGFVQLPPSGMPVVFLADYPVTGGYPVIAVVTDADTDRAAQIRPGQRVRFELSSRSLSE